MCADDAGALQAGGIPASQHKGEGQHGPRKIDHGNLDDYERDAFAVVGE